MKKWVKPKLIFISRSAPEDEMLATCASVSGGYGPENSNRRCTRVWDPMLQGKCGWCT